MNMKIEKTVFLSAFVFVCLLLPGCSRALLFNNGLFSHTIEPLTYNREPTQMRESESQALGRINQFQYPLSSAISVRLGQNGLGDVAKEHGINTIYYADLERWSAAFGLWSMEVVHIYGK